MVKVHQVAVARFASDCAMNICLAGVADPLTTDMEELGPHFSAFPRQVPLPPQATDLVIDKWKKLVKTLLPVIHQERSQADTQVLSAIVTAILLRVKHTNDASVAHEGPSARVHWLCTKIQWTQLSIVEVRMLVNDQCASQMSRLATSSTDDGFSPSRGSRT
mmetsp:Transcript_14300/g.29298  ORF Transcript_14300/g.29298 Transcript_14300/m.29298 type:complete len:162 (-) Transcript_14300:383-868(-)